MSVGSIWGGFARVTVVQTYLLRIAQLLGITLWTLLIGTETLGIAATFTAVLAVPLACLEAGLPAVVVPGREVSSQKWRALCAQQTVLGFSLGAATAVGGPLLAAAYDLPSLAALFVVTGALFPLLAMARLRTQWLYRALHARALAATQWAGLVSRYLAALLVWQFFATPEALAWGAAGAFAAEAVVTLLIVPSERGVAMQWPCREDRSELPSRLWAASDHLLATLRSELDVLLFAGFVDQSTLGVYVYLRRLLIQARDIVLQPLSSVMLNYYARRASAVAPARTVYLEQLGLLASILTPALFTLGALLSLASPVLGGEWARTPDHLPLLVAVFPMLSSLTYMSGALLYALGEVRRLAVYNVAFTLLVAAGYAVVIQGAMSGALLAVAGVWVVSVGVHYLALIRPVLDVRVSTYAKLVAGPLALTALAVVITVLNRPAISIVWAGILGTAVTVIAVLRRRAELGEIFRKLNS